MLGDALALGTAVFALTWFLSFWYRTEKIRERLGVFLAYGDGEEPMDRLDGGGLGGWVNCPQCCAALVWLPVSAAYLSSHFSAGAVLSALGGLGFAVLCVRWYEGARVKARWWE